MGSCSYDLWVFSGGIKGPKDKAPGFLIQEVTSLLQLRGLMIKRKGADNSEEVCRCKVHAKRTPEQIADAG
jgi:hypothetical protein